MNQSFLLKQAVQTFNKDSFQSLALEIFRHQAVHNPIYAQYIHHLGIQPRQINLLEQIPFLPIELFKQHRIVTKNQGSCVDSLSQAEVIFESSGTTGQQRSRHYVADPTFYLDISESIFEHFYGPLADYHILALLPSYLERNNSSLVYMVNHFITRTRSNYSGFFLNDINSLVIRLKELSQNVQKKILLIGVTFALLDLAESNHDLSFLQDTPNLIVMETGGMKGRREELLREEVHEILTKAFRVPTIHSEYGMTELLSQAYSKGEGIFQFPSTLRILLRDVNDPFYISNALKSGGINVIDLANVDSCSFIETKDLGSFTSEGQFRILGRFDNSDIRGCNLMVL